MKLSRRQFLCGALGAAGAVGVPAGFYGAVYEPHDIEVVRKELPIRKLPSRLDGLTAVQISDLHLQGDGDTHGDMVKQIKALDPAAVFFTGDLINEQAATRDALEIFRDLTAPLGTWAVLGNSDHSSGAAETLPVDLKAAGVHFLTNANAELEAGLWMVGVDDPTSYLVEMAPALEGIPSGAPRILLAHSPDVVDQMDGARFDLVLAGHTHGGQINLPWINGAWLLDGASRRYVQGLFDVNGSPMYVNRGIGTAKLPVRIGARPEITHFTFHAA